MSVVRCPLHFRDRTTDYGPWTQLHVGPGGLAADVGGADEEAEGVAVVGGELQAAEGAVVETVDGDPHGGDGRGTKRLDGGPQGVARGLRVDDDQPREVDAPSGRGGWIESSLSVDDDQHAALPARFAGGEQAEGDATAAGRFGDPLDEHAVTQAAAGEQPIKRGGAGRKKLHFGGRSDAVLPCLHAAQLVLQLLDQVVPRIASRGNGLHNFVHGPAFKLARC